MQKKFFFVADCGQGKQREYECEEEEDEKKEIVAKPISNWKMKAEQNTAVFEQKCFGNFSIAFQFVFGLDNNLKFSHNFVLLSFLCALITSLPFRRPQTLSNQCDIQLQWK